MHELAPALNASQENRLLHGWWFMRKAPLKLRYLVDSPRSTAITDLLDQLTGDGRIVAHTTEIYEPEILAFGGELAMDIAHSLFHTDSRILLTEQSADSALGQRETSVLLCNAMMRAAGLDWYEQGDVWAKVAELRPPETIAPALEKRGRLRAAMQQLMTVNAHALCTPNGPLAHAEEWIAAFEEAGRDLAHAARHGRLTRGLRAVLAHHIIFHANRAALPLGDQSAMSALAKEVVMGTSDNLASSTAAPPPGTSVSDVNTDTITEATASAEHLRNALVDQLVKDGHVHTSRVEEAMRTVPRHVFVPAAPLEGAYANTTVSIKDTENGESISCASQPSIVGLMLEQLQPQPGERVLELGAGTGYNAALLAHLVGESGHVTTIDVDDDIVEGARSHLTAAGIQNVTVLLRDGALGHPDGAPYDKIIATVGAHGIPHAWLDQLTPSGRLLVPQRLRGSVSRSIAFENRDGAWVSVGSEMNTFMPLRRGIADDARPLIPLTADGSVRLQTNQSQPADAEALFGVLDQPRTVVWADVFYRAMESPEWMELWISCSMPNGLNQMPFRRAEVVGSLLTEDPYPSSTAVFEKDTLTYLTRRLSTRTTPEGGKLWEFGVVGHGPESDALAAKVADSMRTWDRDYRSREARFEIQSLNVPPVESEPGLFTVDTPLNRILIDWR